MKLGEGKQKNPLKQMADGSAEIDACGVNGRNAERILKEAPQRVMHYACAGSYGQLQIRL